MIRLEGCSRKYGKFQAVYPTDLHVRPGEIYALLGPNGGGKTTLLKSIVGLARPDSGTVVVYANDLWERPETAKAGLTYLPQRVTIPENLTVLEVLRFFAGMKDAAAGRIGEVLDKIDIKAAMDQKVGALSGGMLQRLALVITFLGDTPVYVLDEPTLNLDLAGTRRFRNFLKALKTEGKTVLFSSHTLMDAETLADRVGVMVKGRLVIDASVAEFRQRVKNQTRMTLVVAGSSPDLVNIALDSGATSAEFENGYFRYRADQARQIKVLEAIRRTGVEILDISTEQPALDQLVEEHYE